MGSTIDDSGDMRGGEVRKREGEIRKTSRKPFFERIMEPETVTTVAALTQFLIFPWDYPVPFP